MAGQQTEGLQQELLQWMGCYESSKASLPPFNVGCGALLPGTQSYNVPVFGPLINGAVMELFEEEKKVTRAQKSEMYIYMYIATLRPIRCRLVSLNPRAPPHTLGGAEEA